MKILIATDGSEYGRHAVAECCRMFPDLASHEISIISVYEDAYPIGTEAYIPVSTYSEQLTDALRKSAESAVSESKAQMEEAFAGKNLNIRTSTVLGSPDQAIVNKAAEWEADLVIVGSHGRGFWGRLLGSVSDGVVHHSPCSVLVVRP